MAGPEEHYMGGGK